MGWSLTPDGTLTPCAVKAAACDGKMRQKPSSAAPILTGLVDATTILGNLDAPRQHDQLDDGEQAKGDLRGDGSAGRFRGGAHRTEKDGADDRHEQPVPNR